MSRQYLKYLIKTNKNQYLFLLFVMLVVMPLMVINTQSSISKIAINGYYIIYIASFVLVALNLKILHKKRAVDTYFQLPLSKECVYLTTVTFIIIEIISTYLLALLFSIIVSKFQFSYTVNEQVLLIPYLKQIVIAFGLTIASVFINSFFYQVANSEFDGNVFLILMLGNSFVISYCFGLFVDANSFDNTFSSRVFNLNILANVLYFVEDLNNTLTKEKIIFIAIVISSIIFFIISYFQIKNKKGESAEQISTAIEGYPLVKYLGVISCLLLVFSFIDNLAIAIGLIFTYILFVCADMIYKRNVKLSILQSIIFIGLVLGMFGFKQVFVQAKAFGLDDYHYQKYQSIEVLIDTYNQEAPSENLISLKNVDQKTVEILYDGLRDDYYYSRKTDLATNANSIASPTYYENSKYVLTIIYHKVADNNDYNNQYYKYIYFNNLEKVEEVLNGKNIEDSK